MTDSDIKTEAKMTRNTRAFWVLVALTLAYCLLYYLLIIETKPCQGVVISPSAFAGFFDRYLACQDINQLGGALAGAFAPVAFLWLAGAVFIQSQELKAQREELADTRAVMREQVTETRASTALFTEQTQILKNQEILREQEQADEEYDEQLVALHQLIEAADGLPIFYKEPGSIQILARIFGDLKKDAPLNTIIRLSLAAMDHCRKEQQRTPRVVTFNDEAVELICFRLKDIIAVANRLSPAHSIKVNWPIVGMLIAELEAFVVEFKVKPAHL